MHSLTEFPIVWRVWWQHHSDKLVSRPLRPEDRDFGTKTQAIAFRQSLRDHFPDCACCIRPTKGRADRRRRR